MARVVYNLESLQYDGTNGAYICGTWLDVALISESGGTLVWSTPEGTATAHSTDWVIRTGVSDTWGRVVPNDQYVTDFYELP